MNDITGAVRRAMSKWWAVSGVDGDLPGYVEREVRAALAASSGWQPIETAPRDGTPILIPGGMAIWSNGGWQSITGIAYPGRPIEWPVTHWMPLPTPSAAQEQP